MDQLHPWGSKGTGLKHPLVYYISMNCLAQEPKSTTFNWKSLMSD